MLLRLVCDLCKCIARHGLTRSNAKRGGKFDRLLVDLELVVLDQVVQRTRKGDAYFERCIRNRRSSRLRPRRKRIRRSQLTVLRAHATSGEVRGQPRVQ